MRTTITDEAKFGEPKMRLALSPRNQDGINAGDIVEITEGDRQGQRGLIFFRSFGGRAFIQFEDGSEQLFEAHRYKDPPQRMFNTALADGIQRVRKQLGI